MPAVPETKYARSGDFHIAYQTIGEGPPDLIFVHGWISHIEHMWEEPGLARFLRRLASFSRLVLLDKRGTGLSDPVPLNQLPTPEERMDDLRTVMDAVGCRRAALLGTSEAGALNLLFAATHPERSAALILLNSYARLAWAPDQFRGREVDTAGDGFLAAFDGPARAIRCAYAITTALGQLGIEVRAGLHMGECELVADKVSGIAVHLGARIAAEARAAEVLVSSTVKDLVAGSGIRFEDRGTHTLRGIPEGWRLFAVASEKPA